MLKRNAGRYVSTASGQVLASPVWRFGPSFCVCAEGWVGRRAR
jgi:hypothetical protein